MDRTPATTDRALLIRDARLSDMDAVAAIFRTATLESNATFAIEPEPVSEWVLRFEQAGRRHPWLVAEQGGSVVGFARAHAFRARAAYSNTVETSVYLARGAQRRGIGRALMLALLDALRRQGYHAVVAVTTAENAAARAFHRALGMQEIGTLRELGWKFDAWLGVTFLHLLLRPAGTLPAAIQDAPEVREFVRA